MPAEPMTRSKDDYTDVIERISVRDSPVGIDAQLTHAIIITYLQQIMDRLNDIESQLKATK